MKLFKKSTMSVALTAVMAGGALMGLSAPASAVSVAENGLGDAMIFPYYTVRNDWRTYFHITNTSNKTVLMKVRWNEGVNSRDARDFNVILSPFDVWTAATIPSPAGGAMVITNDNTCTVPPLPPAAGRTGFTGVGFSSDAYSGTNADTGATDLDRNSEGYFTVFEMGTVDENSTGEALIVHNAAKHGPATAANNTAVPSNCALIDTIHTNNTRFADLIRQTNEPLNVLKGTAILINPANGIAAGYDPVTMADFYSPLGTDGTATVGSNLITQPSTQFPNLNQADPAVAQYVGSPNTLQTRPVDAVSELFSRTNLINDFNVAGISETAWVATFPTKGFYVDEGTGSYAKLSAGSNAPLAPFTDALVGGNRFGSPVLGKSCVNFTARLWDREEFEAAPSTITSNFSPVPDNAPSDQQQFCYESNILSFGDSNVFGSALKASIFAGKEADMPGLNGWAELSFNNPTRSANNPLPVVGMKVEQRKDTNQPDKFFGFANDHSYRR